MKTTKTTPATTTYVDPPAGLRHLTGPERGHLQSGRGQGGGAGAFMEGLTCERDAGHGPCGTYLDWVSGYCLAGHRLYVEAPDID